VLHTKEKQRLSYKEDIQNMEVGTTQNVEYNINNMGKEVTQSKEVAAQNIEVKVI